MKESVPKQGDPSRGTLADDLTTRKKAWDMIAMVAPRGLLENGVRTTNLVMVGLALGKTPWNWATMTTK